MIDIFQFEKTITKQTIAVPGTTLVIENCRIYTINRGNEIIGRFYTNGDWSYGKVADKAITIEYKNRVLRKSNGWTFELH